MAAGGEKAKSTIVIKRIKKGGHGHHGGVWKIAYADFVTAMMAFFLLMWLLGSTTKGDLKGIADFFASPLQVAMMGGSGAGDANSVIQGGGVSLTDAPGQVKRGDTEADKRKRRQARQREERARMEELKVKVEGVLATNARLTDLRNQIRVEVTPDGLRIQIVDDFNRPMFALGGAQVQPYMRELLREIGSVLNQVENKVALSGHTDSAAYAGGERGYSNWELSADRANASRRELVAGGMEVGKIVRVVGLADSNLLVKEDPRNPLNRRISIIVLNKIAEERLNRAGGEIETGNIDEVRESLPETRAAADAAQGAGGAAPGGGGTDGTASTPAQGPGETPATR